MEIGPLGRRDAIFYDAYASSYFWLYIGSFGNRPTASRPFALNSGRPSELFRV